MHADLDAGPDAITAEEAAQITDLDPVELASRPELDHDDGTYSRAECEDLARELGAPGSVCLCP